MKPYKAITNIPGWSSVLRSKDKIKDSAGAYSLVPLVYRGLRLRCDSLASVPVHVYKGKNEVPWPFLVSPADLLWKMEAAMLAYGAGYAEIAYPPNSRMPGNLVWVNPSTITVEYDSGTYRFTQKNRKEPVTWENVPGEKREMLYMREFSLDDDVQPGVAALDVALTDAQLMHYMRRFTSYFFEQGAMPVTLLGIDTNDEDEIKRVEGVFQKMMTNVANAFKVIGIRAGSIDPKILTPAIKDLAMPGITADTRRNLGDALGIPKAMLDDASNHAVAKEHRAGFWHDTVKPSGMSKQGQLNEQVFNPMGLRLELAYDEMDIFQEDENERASSFNSLVQGGFDPLTASEVLGYNLDDVQRKRIAQYSGVVYEGKAGIVTTLEADVRKWERKAIRRMKAGKSAVCDFDSTNFTEEMYQTVKAGLELAKSVEEVSITFSGLLGDKADG